MSEGANKPLLTLAVAAFNQERFVRAAVEGAFAQTYSPLQIILSDDASKDRTFAIMRELAAAYRGPHQVVLNQNPTNAGLASHSNRIFSLARGELVVLNAGDDISLPHRVAAIAQAWEASGRKSFGVHSRVLDMDDSGRVQGETPSGLRRGVFQFEDGLAAVKQFMREEQPVILGCTAAWHRALFDKFGPLPLDVMYEDMTLGFRARLLGGMAFIDDPLVLYRLHDANVHHADFHAPASLAFLRAEEQRRKVGLERRLAAARCFQADVATARSGKMLGDSELQEVAAAVAGFARSHEAELSFRNASWFGRLAYYPELKRRSTVQTAATGNLSHLLLPRWMYFAARMLKSRMRELRRPSPVA
jgi:glycosyltransferase involved in cell wall biosynthesis